MSVLALGGTIACTSTGTGLAPTLDAEQLLATLPPLDEVARVSAQTFRELPSIGLTLPDIKALADEIEERLTSGDTGIVVTQGTDTLEETAFALDLLIDSDAPVVLTGAMRGPTAPGADGPANLIAAVRTAASEHARGLGCLVVLSDEIHAARFVRKAHTQSLAAFRSAPAGPIGWLSEEKVRIGTRPCGRRRLKLDRVTGQAPVALVTASLDEPPLLLGAVASVGYRGLVVEAAGGGHVPGAWVPDLERLASEMPVVIASRTGAGETLQATYSFPGSEIDLIARGLIPSGTLTGSQARVLLRLLLGANVSLDQIRAAFEAIAVPGRAAELIEGRLLVSA